MFISKDEIQKDNNLAAKIKNWAGSLNIAAKTSGCQTFKLAGPCEFKVRLRKAGAGPGTLMGYRFTGGEEFRLSSVVLEKDLLRDGIEIRTIFTPVDLLMVMEISSMAMPLQEAIEAFEGLEAWADLSVVETTAAQREKAHEKAEIDKLPSVEEVHASAAWGAW